MGSETAAPAASTVPAGETTNALAKESDRKPALPKEHPYAILAAAKEWFGSLGSETAAPVASTVPADETTDGLAKGPDRKPALPKEHPYAIWAAAKQWFGNLGSETAVKAVSNAGTAGKVGVQALHGVPALTAEARAATSAGLPVFSLEPHAGGVIRSFVQETDQIYYRVFTQGQTGGFLTAVRPGSSAFAQEALALPPQNTATFIQEVLVPAGTRLQRSRALPAFGHRGGAEQFQLMNQIPPRNFGPGVPLQ